jgi:hypothetical protein
MICTSFDRNWLASSGEKVFKYFNSIQTHVKIVFPIVASLDPGDHDLYKLEFAVH